MPHNRWMTTSDHVLPDVTFRNWRRADFYGLEADLHGRRATLVNSSGSHHDYRAWTRLLADGKALVVWVVTDAEWWAHSLSGDLPRPVRWPAQAVWVEEA